MKKYVLLVTLLNLVLTGFAYGDDLKKAEEIDIHTLVGEPLFVSLGSVCEVAHALRACDIRKAAFPFDWITSIDSEKFLEILSQDFQYFLDENCFCVADKGPGPILHTYYHLEFLHEGDFRGDLYEPNMQKLQEKYQRRIQRFRSLSEYKGKVFFVRTAYQYSMTDPHRYYFCKENLEISDEYSWRLFDLLQKRFPALNFTLIIINNDAGDGVREEVRLSDRLIKIRSNPSLDLKWDSYKTYFSQKLN